MNLCIFTGNLGAEPEIRTFQNGNKVANLRLAVSERWKDKQTGEKKERTEWVSVAIFTEGLIRVCEQYLHKGSKVMVQGKFTTRKWQDQSGNDRYSTEIVIQGFGGSLERLDGRSEGQSKDSGQGGYGQEPSGRVSDMEEDIPF